MNQSVHPFSIKQDDVQTDRPKFLDLESGDTILWLRRDCDPCNFHKTQWLCLGHSPQVLTDAISSKDSLITLAISVLECWPHMII